MWVKTKSKTYDDLDVMEVNDITFDLLEISFIEAGEEQYTTVYFKNGFCSEVSIKYDTMIALLKEQNISIKKIVE